MSLTAEQVEKALDSALYETTLYRNEEGHERIGWERGYSYVGGSGQWEPIDGERFEDWNEIGGYRIVIDGVTYELKSVHETGGTDEGSNATVTFQVGDQYFRKSGYYASHYGYDWDGPFEEVKPKTVEVVIYE